MTNSIIDYGYFNNLGVHSTWSSPTCVCICRYYPLPSVPVSISVYVIITYVAVSVYVSVIITHTCECICWHCSMSWSMSTLTPFILAALSSSCLASGSRPWTTNHRAESGRNLKWKLSYAHQQFFGVSVMFELMLIYGKVLVAIA